MKSKERIFTQRLKDKLLTEMARQGLNGQKLAQRSRVSDSEISRILSGQSTPGLENAFRLARAVSVSLDFLADDMLETDPLQVTDPLSHEERRVLDLIHQTGTAKAIQLLEIIRYIGYETAMQRLLMTKPLIELDLEDERAASPTTSAAPSASMNTVPASRSNSA